MSFDIQPVEYFGFFKEAHREFQADDLSLRRAITCFILANHLPEHVHARYGGADPSKVRNCNSEKAYRQALETSEPKLGVVRDLCDFAKHGPKLGRKNVKVSKTEQGTQLQLSSMGYFMGTMHHEAVDALIVTLDDQSEQSVRHFLHIAEDFWEREFAALGL
jgi:hypothetical protein